MATIEQPSRRQAISSPWLISPLVAALAGPLWAMPSWAQQTSTDYAVLAQAAPQASDLGAGVLPPSRLPDLPRLPAPGATTPDAAPQGTGAVGAPAAAGNAAPVITPLGTPNISPAQVPSAATAAVKPSAAPTSPPLPGAVATSSPLASSAAIAMLKRGGNALDAAIAAAMVLGVVEPQSSGIGGGAVMLLWDASNRRIDAWDGRETAPAAAPPGLFLQDGLPMSFDQASLGGRSVGVPGELRMLEAAHHAQGKLPWAELFGPAIALAQSGFPVSPRLAAAIAANAEALKTQPAASFLFMPDGSPAKEGSTIRNPALASVLETVARDGAIALHQGPLATAIAAAVRSSPNAGLMTTDDLAGYVPKHREALCLPYRHYSVCGFPPPSSGGVAVGQILGMLRQVNMAALEPGSADAAMILGEAGRLAFADRNTYLADADIVPVPVRGLLDPNYLMLRAQSLSVDHAPEVVTAGNPPWSPGTPPAPQPPQPEHGTTQLSVLDSAGNAVSLTATVERSFGARLVVQGIVLNNELTDFSFLPEVGGRAIANRVQGGKRPRSSMAPTMVFDAQGRLVDVLGSAGGGRIIGHVAQALVALLDWNLPPEAVAGLPHVAAYNQTVELEAATAAAGLAPALQARGLPVTIRPNPSGLEILQIQRNGTPAVAGGTDPRREGQFLTE